jgi:signal transduction histidine kinase
VITLSFITLITSQDLAAQNDSLLSAVTCKGFLKKNLTVGSVSYLIDSTSAFGISQISGMAFPVSYSFFKNRIRRPSTEDHFWIKFDLTNHSDSSIQIYLYCGDLNYVNLYLLSEGQSVQVVRDGNLRSIRPENSFLKKTSPTIPFFLKAKQRGVLFLELVQKTEDFSFDDIVLYDSYSLFETEGEDFEWTRNEFIFQLIFQGFVLCQLLYAFFQWIIIRRREYLYYFFYIFSVSLYFLSKFEHSYYVQVVFSRLPLMTVYLNKTLLILPYFFYFRFVRSFLDMPVNYPIMNKWLIRIENFLLVYMIFDLIFILITFNVRMQREIYSVIFILVFLTAVSFIFYLFGEKKKLIYYVLTGSLFAGLGNVIGLVLTNLNDASLLHNISGILLFSQTGIILEIFCFTAGLSYKSMSVEKEKIKSQESLIEQLKANEQLQKKMQHIRNHIAQDLHDDIGSTLSSISILSNLALKNKNSGQTLATMNEIKNSSVNLMEKMDDIVWSINPRNDTLENLLLRIKRVATVLFEAQNIDYAISIPENITEVMLPMEWRQHIYLILKEAINNLVKYSEATRALIEVNYQDSELRIHLEDNGRGFDISGSSSGNGLLSMKNRSDLMQAELTIYSSAGQGTRILLRLKIK